MTTSAVLAATPTLEPTIRIFSVPSYLPDAKPAALKYLAETSGSGLPSTDRKSTPVPFAPPASSKPAVPGGRKCVAMSPTVLPPRVSSSALRSMPAMTALRTFGSSNGLIVVFSAIQRPPIGGASLSCSGVLSHARP